MDQFNWLCEETSWFLRLCLDHKGLNIAIKHNQWYKRTINDVLPELANSKYFSLLDAKSAIGTFYWTRRVVCRRPLIHNRAGTVLGYAYPLG